MKREGSEGSLSLYYKGLLISTFPLTKKKSFEVYREQGDMAIITGMKDENIPIKEQIQIYISFLNNVYSRKKNNKSIWRNDHYLCCATIFALLKLKIIDNDELNGFLIMPKIKKLKTKKDFQK